MGTPAMLGQLGGAQALQGVPGGMGNLPPGIQMQVQAVQTALGQQVQAYQQQVQGLTQGTVNIAGGGPTQTPQLAGMDGNGLGNQIPPPPPPVPAMPLVPLPQGGFAIVPPGVQPNQGHGHHNPVPPQHGNNIPPPPPLHLHPLGPGQPQPLNPGHQHHHHHHAHHAHTLYTTFLRFEREIGLESLCLSLHETLRERSEDSSLSTSPSPSPSRSLSPATIAATTPVRSPPPEVKIVCIMRIPRREVERLVHLYPAELSVDERTRDARTRFRKLHGVEVSLELNGYSMGGGTSSGAGVGGVEEEVLAHGSEVQGS